MSNELTIKNNNLPIKAYPKEDLKNVLEGTFLVWISNLLGLTGEDAAKRLLIALPAIEKHFWSLGFNEIEKAFTMYADGQLKTKPLPNYFTRILVGQIFNEYRDQKPKPKPIQIDNKIPEAEKEKIVKQGVLRVYKEFLDTGIVPPGSSHVYDLLYNLGVLPKHTKEFREKIRIEAVENLKIQARKEFHLSDMEKAKEKIKNSQGVKGECKRIILTNFFEDCKEWDIDMKEKIKL